MSTSYIIEIGDSAVGLAMRESAGEAYRFFASDRRLHRLDGQAFGQLRQIERLARELIGQRRSFPRNARPTP